MPSIAAGAEAPRLYQLDPQLAGPMTGWSSHFDRIRNLGFDGVLISALRRGPDADAPGGRDGPLALDSGEFDGVENVSAALSDLVDLAARERLAVVLEIALTGAGSDPRDAAVVEARMRHHLATGARGLLVSGAHNLAAPLWTGLLATLADAFPDRWVIAGMLGAPLESWQAYEEVGFTGVLDSSRWWNFHDHWFLEQQPRLARIGAPFAFPEEPGGARLAASIEGGPDAVRRALQTRYLAALGLGTGLIMPMGFEYGASETADAMAAGGGWAALEAQPPADLTAFIKTANALKDKHPALSRIGALRRVNAPNARTAALARLAHPSPAMAAEVVFVLANPADAEAGGVDAPGLITAAGGRFETLEDITPGSDGDVVDVTHPITLEPGEVRLVASQAVAGRASKAARGGANVARKLEKMAEARVAIEKVEPELDGGRFPVKRVVGDRLTVEADIFMDGHDKLRAALLTRPADGRGWTAVPMTPTENDRWAGHVPLLKNGRYAYTVEAWLDVFGSWRIEVTKKHAAGVPIALELEEGRRLVAQTAAAAGKPHKAALDALVGELDERRDDEGFQLARLLSSEVEALMEVADPKRNLTRYERELEVIVDRTIAAFAAWYELFPRSQSDDPNRHGTFDDVIRKLPYVRDMGFDVLYFPPIHPVGRVNRKGRNNSLTPQEDDPGSPYAIGSEDGGHDALHPQLGTFDDFRRLNEAAHAHGLEMAIDFAIQCSPDHPWLKEHPEWFAWRPDGSLRYAENPPKKYEDITNVDFYAEAALPSLWVALRDVVQFWVDNGIKIFRVDNPHTKPLPFWEWLIGDIQSRHPETIFLAEAFTRPKMMRRLAKLGFSQSYSYFTWRNSKAELQEYLVELTREEPHEHMRPNFFVNTPDINPVYLQTSGRPGFQVRAVLASTLSTLWGVYSGFELCEATPLPGKEEYLDSEKYEIKAWDWHRPTHIRDDIRLLNAIRRENPALWTFTNLEFHNAWNDNVMVFSKMTPSRDNAVLVAVNLDPHNAQNAAFEVPLWHFGLEDSASIGVEDLLTGARFTWTGKVQQAWLDPYVRPYQIWRLVPPGLAAASPFADRR